MIEGNGVLCCQFQMQGRALLSEIIPLGDHLYLNTNSLWNVLFDILGYCILLCIG